MLVKKNNLSCRQLKYPSWCQQKNCPNQHWQKKPNWQPQKKIHMANVGQQTSQVDINQKIASTDVNKKILANDPKITLTSIDWKNLADASKQISLTKIDEKYLSWPWAKNILLANISRKIASINVRPELASITDRWKQPQPPFIWTIIILESIVNFLKCIILN